MHLNKNAIYENINKKKRSTKRIVRCWYCKSFWTEQMCINKKCHAPLHPLLPLICVVEKKGHKGKKESFKAEPRVVA